MEFHRIKQRKGIAFLLIGAFCFIFGWLASQHAVAFSVRGTFLLQGKGFQDLAGEDHLIAAPGLRFHAYDLGIKGISAHGYLQYYGDNQDDFSASGTSRLYHGYLKYSTPDSPLSARGGRFFLFRGVAVGVLDGGEVSYRFSRKVQATAFAGQQGPLNREWEVDRQGDSPWFGGELRLRPGRVLGIRPTIALSYTRQERNDDLMRHLAGLSIGFKLGKRWSSLNVLHLNLEGSALRKVITRWRYWTPKVQMTFEGGALQPYVAAYSYFSDFNSESITKRLKVTAEYHFVPRTWGAGVTSMVFATTENSLRFGPYVVFPFGRLGYNYSTGDHSNKNVFWGHLQYSPKDCLDLYGYAAMMEYEWEAMLEDTYETTALMAGLRLRPKLLKKTEFELEWQHYQTPEVESDRRLIGSIRWNFDIAGK